MNLRQLLNITYAHLAKRWPANERARLDEMLEEKYDWELTPEELADRNYFREAERIGAVTGQQDLMDAFGIRPADV